MSEYLATFEIEIHFRLDDAQCRTAMRAINTKFLGRPQLRDLTERVSKAHEDATWNAARGQIVTITVGLSADGTLVVIGIKR